jgi:hypothetical protein
MQEAGLRGWGSNLSLPRIFLETTCLFFLTSDFDFVHMKNMFKMGTVKFSVVII